MHRVTAVLLSLALVAPWPAATAGVHEDHEAPQPTSTLHEALDALEATEARVDPSALEAAQALAERGGGLAEADTGPEALEALLDGALPAGHPARAAGQAGAADEASPLERSRDLAPALPGNPAPASEIDQATGAPSSAPVPEGVPDGIPEPVTRVLAAYVALEAAVPEPPLTPDEVDQVTAARDQALGTILSTLPELQAVDQDLVYRKCGVGAVDLAGTSQTYDCPLPVIVDVGGDDEYVNEAGGAHQGAAVLVDLAGDDLYAPADGTGDAVVGGAQTGAAVLVDASGDDVYTVERDARVTATGSAVAGAATLYDGGGRDRYAVTVDNLDDAPALAHGSSLGGSGRLVDASGRDRYHVNATGTAAANGAALDGVARLVDEAGDDRYNATVNRTGAANGASSNMTAAFDALPEPVADSLASHDGRLSAGERTDVQLELGLRGSALLHDRAGSDTYRAQMERGVAQGAATLGAGILVDDGGDDAYEARVGSYGAANGAGYVGLGVLADTDGDDAYRARVPAGALNGGGHLGVGALVDDGGNDDYRSTLEDRGGAHGGALLGVGLLADSGGTNTHDATGPALGGTLGAAHGLPLPAAGFVESAPPRHTLDLQLGIPGSVGILVAGPGADDYVGDNLTQGAGQLYGQGILLDRGGANTYEAPAGSLAQGAARWGGTGILVDRGISTSFELAQGSQGQGVGVQGAGLLLRSPPEAPGSPPATTSYQHPGLGEVRTSGGGVGLLIDRAQAEGLSAPSECSTDPLPAPSSVAGVDVLACSPKPEAEVAVRDPVTGEPIGGDPTQPDGRSDRLPKPALCANLPAATDACLDLLRDTTSDEAVDWFESDHVHTRTDGAVEVVLAGASTDPLAVPLSEDGSDGGRAAWALIESATADGTCRPYCWGLHELG